MVDKVIFLDIDGVMIPKVSYLWDRHAGMNQVFDPRCTQILLAILKESGAKLVINSTHNVMMHRRENGGTLLWPGLYSALEDAKISSEYWHEDFNTVYPGIHRLLAIKEWLHRHPEVTKWVALDDVPLEDERAFPVDSEHGLGYESYQHSLFHLVGREKQQVYM